ncbi:Protein of unknown function [Gryllus bimaculatus]|nr:Protein of unknown function [Gryllus bimaculatus]
MQEIFLTGHREPSADLTTTQDRPENYEFAQKDFEQLANELYHGRPVPAPFLLFCTPTKTSHASNGKLAIALPYGVMFILLMRTR